MIGPALLVFACGAAYEAGSVAYIHFSERNKPVRTALCSMVQALAEVTGIFESVTDLRMARWFVLGFGVGTYVAVRLKARGRGVARLTCPTCKGAKRLLRPLTTCEETDPCFTCNGCGTVATVQP